MSADDLIFGLLAGSPFLILMVIMTCRQCYIRGWTKGYSEATDNAIAQYKRTNP